jgi:hypothetical protein
MLLIKTKVMEVRSVIQNSSDRKNKTAGKGIDWLNISRKVTGLSISTITLFSEGGFSFFRYLNILGLSGDPGLIILSSRNRYSCGENDLRAAGTLINLKKLNLIKHLDLFLNTLVRILPPGTNFIGCFSERKSSASGMSRADFISAPADLLHAVPFLKKNNYIDKSEVIELLERNNFRIIDMREKNGLTYFLSKKAHTL